MSKLTKEEFEKELERLRDEHARCLRKIRLQPHPFIINPPLDKKWTRVKEWKKMKKWKF